MGEQVERPPRLIIQLYALTGHRGPQDAFLCGAADREPFRAVRRLEGRDDALRVRLEAPRLFLRASIRSITLDGSRSFSSSIFSPFCFFFNRSFKASS